MLSRVVRLVEAFRQGEEWVTVSDLSRRTGLHLATVSRLVAELAEHGWLERDEARRVRLGLRLWEVAARASSALSLREAAMPVLEDLHAQVRQHAQIGVLEGKEVLFLERLSAPQAVVNYSRIAGRIPLNASSSGLVLLAHSDPTFQEEVLAGPLEAFTEHTPANPERVRRLLATVRRTGSVCCPGFLHQDAAGIAAPVFRHGKAVATLSVVVPNMPGACQYEPLLRIAAATVTRRLDGNG
ncbi:UNVERIFIED_CONTAM: IclR family transcriptional regulator [Kocuria sp. CPCC 205316]|uniref:IclR family transcriptional regulator n=1 Tax=Kocuria TaxID=57493 RepID=UPI0036D82FB9